MSSADFDTVAWNSGPAIDLYPILRNKDRNETGETSGTIGSTENLSLIISAPVLISEAEKYVASRLPSLSEGEVEAIAVWKPNAFKKHTINVATIIPGSDIPASNRLEAIEQAVIAKAGLKAGERAANIKILSETPKYVSLVETSEHKETLYYIIGNGIDANAVLNGETEGFISRAAAKAELKNVLSRSRSTRFHLPIAEEFEVVGITRVAKAKTELSKLAVRAKLDVVNVDANRPRDGWLFYGVGVL